MRVLLRLGKEKRAISNMVGYVILISITIGLSVLVYNWLSFYIGEDDIPECSDGVNIIIRSYECYATSSESTGRLTVVLKNKGRFSVDGYTLRVHDREGAEFGFYTLDKEGEPIAPGAEHEETYEFGAYTFDDYQVRTVTLVEVQPFVMDGDNISCRSYASQDVSCYSGSATAWGDGVGLPESGSPGGGGGGGGWYGNPTWEGDDITPDEVPGDGTDDNPYLIGSCVELSNMRNDLTADYVLQNDIGCYVDTHEGGDLWNGGKGFDPIGTGGASENFFVGSFDGDGYQIIGLYINRNEFNTNYVGLFGFIGSSAVIQNVGLEYVDVTGNWFVGGLVGRSYEEPVNIINSYVDGVVVGDMKVGGLIGQNGNGSVITDSYSVADVIGVAVFGGTDTIGGLVGHNYGSVVNSYATGDVSGDSVIGGLVGENAVDGSTIGEINNSYAVGEVVGGSSGGLVGVNSGSIVNSYWSSSQGACCSSACGGCTNEVSASAFYDSDHDVYNSGTPVWDFGGVWREVIGSYPELI